MDEGFCKKEYVTSMEFKNIQEMHKGISSGTVCLIKISRFVCN